LELLLYYPNMSPEIQRILELDDVEKYGARVQPAKKKWFVRIETNTNYVLVSNSVVHNWSHAW
jgi:hypothetical protein